MNGVAWPPGLEQLLFGRVFNQQIQGTVWASGLRQLALGDFFDQALNEVAWPANLERLSLGSKFNQVRLLFLLGLVFIFSSFCLRFGSAGCFPFFCPFCCGLDLARPLSCMCAVPVAGLR